MTSYYPNYPEPVSPTQPGDYEHNPRCEDETWYRCPDDGLFQPVKIGRGENRCPECKLMRPRTGECVCLEIWSTE